MDWFSLQNRSGVPVKFPIIQLWEMVVSILSIYLYVVMVYQSVQSTCLKGVVRWLQQIFLNVYTCTYIYMYIYICIHMTQLYR